MPGLLRGLLSFNGDVLRALPRVAYRRQVMAVTILRRQIVVVNDPEVVRDVFVTRHAIYGRKSHFKEQALSPVIGESLFANHGSLWATRRPAVARLLHPSGVGQFQEAFREAGRRLIEDWSAPVAAAGGSWDGQGGGTPGEPAGGATRDGAAGAPRGKAAANAPGAVVDVAPDLAAATLRVMLRAVFGPDVPEGEARAIAQAFGEYQSRVQVVDLPHLLGLPRGLLGRQGRIAQRAAAEIRARVAALIARPPSGEGLLPGLRAAPAADGRPLLDETGLLDEVAMMLLAGSETAANALAWCLFLLASDPAWATRVRDEAREVLGEREPDAAELNGLLQARAVLQEAMRLYPPVAVLARQAVQVDRIRRWTLRPGDTLLCIPWLLHRHENLWDAPHAFRPARFLPENSKAIPRFAYLPFGVGPRVCAGAAFGMAEMTTLLAMLIRRFALAPAPGVVPMPRFRLTLRPEGGMPLLLRPAP
ncbi:cytochrome P450 [Roseomonas sp. BN140053]|uniref:cytochrome P450 n=1 Tax=Roseomonas sp. BN140053 TaxID=3391898 RepID=UPI0039E950E4